MVWTVARACGLGPADAGEVSQVTWLLLTQHLAGLKEPERLGVWLLRTASREAYRIGRLRGSEVADADELSVADHLLEWAGLSSETSQVAPVAQSR